MTTAQKWMAGLVAFPVISIVGYFVFRKKKADEPTTESHLISSLSSKSIQQPFEKPVITKENPTRSDTLQAAVNTASKVAAEVVKEVVLSTPRNVTYTEQLVQSKTTVQPAVLVPSTTVPDYVKIVGTNVEIPKPNAASTVSIDKVNQTIYIEPKPVAKVESVPGQVNKPGSVWESKTVAIDYVQHVPDNIVSTNPVLPSVVKLAERVVNQTVEVKKPVVVIGELPYIQQVVPPAVVKPILVGNPPNTGKTVPILPAPAKTVDPMQALRDQTAASLQKAKDLLATLKTGK